MSPRRRIIDHAAPPASHDHGDDWRDQAACTSHDPDLWYSTNYAERDQARAICAQCPVSQQCAIAGTGELHGIWAGQAKEHHFRDEQPKYGPCPICAKPQFTSRMTKHTKAAHGTCPAGHDMTAPGTVAQRGECKKCRQAKDASRRRLGTRTPVKERCVKGHDTTDPDARYAGGQCKKCISAANRRKRENARAIADSQNESATTRRELIA